MVSRSGADNRVELRLPLDAQLAEGLHWDAERAELWGVDIHGKTLWRWDLESPAWQHWRVGQRVGWVLPVRGTNQLLLGLQQGFALVERDAPAQPLWQLNPFPGRAAMRLNDAKADASGAVWAGSMNNDDETRTDGCLYRLGTNGQMSTVDSGYTVANGPAISPDSRLMLHTDSGQRTIYAFALDTAAGTLHDKRVWKRFSDDEGFPDGMCFDAEGCVWVAHWGAGCISRFSPDGALLRRVSVPATQVSNVCFAGPRLERLLVSTARIGLPAAALVQQPAAGGVFEVLDPGTCGLPGLACGPFTF